MAIYQEGENIRYTQSNDGDVIYAISLALPGEHLRLRQVQPVSGKPITLLGFEDPLAWQVTEQGDVLIDMAALLQQPDQRPAKYAWVFRIEGEVVPVAAMPVDGKE